MQLLRLCEIVASVDVGPISSQFWHGHTFIALHSSCMFQQTVIGLLITQPGQCMPGLAGLW